MRQWYHVGSRLDLDPFKASDDTDEVLHATDSEEESLVQTDSEPPASDHGDASDEQILLETDSEGCPEPPLKRRAYRARDATPLTFLGKEVCQYAHQRLYGVGSGAVQNLRRGKAAFTMENWLKEPKHPTLGTSLVRQSRKPCKWQNVLAFLWIVYNSCAEILPVRFAMPKGTEGRFESYLKDDVDFQERYVRAYMSNLERNYDLNLAS